MKNYKSYLLIAGLVVSTAFFSLLGDHWNRTYYQQTDTYSAQNLPFIHAMTGLHDGLAINEFSESAMSVLAAAPKHVPAIIDKIQDNYQNLLLSPSFHHEVLAELPLSRDALSLQNSAPFPVPIAAINQTPLSSDPIAANTPTSIRARKTYEFTSASEEYFKDAVFIGDSRTVGLCEYSDITNATFLCKTSLTIYDYDKPCITYQDKKMSIKEVLSRKQFAKIYVMLGINEASYGSTESYLESYRKVIANIRALQPESLIFIQANLFITEEKSSSGSITNKTLSERNAAISDLANQYNTFFIDINESTLCEDGALIPDYTWDHIHIKAQYYPLWKDFLLEHAIIKE